MYETDRITSSPEVMMGKPVIRGTRITVEHVLEELAGGMTFDDLLAAHPQLTREDLSAAVAFAVDAVRLERLGALRAAS
ncbi:hypothetical protein SOCEGT47_036430 [Sorangium cellulosum]|uniref:Antitoxin n=1 Tax=Sorangium cellulosum TaxID=56 RepID=A0A4P2Q1M1_SORCE|nr:DUF433 domain-containing protein [Sorangium cellulosum]AUX23124.1 hypothetical protein SOCEGT47_036430 [Sorangium cellulosum]